MTIKPYTREEFDAIQGNTRDSSYGPAFMKAVETDHGWSNTLFGHILWLMFQPKSAIEFGCGTGRVLAALESHGVLVSGLDFSPHVKPFIAMRSPEIAERVFIHDLAKPWQYSNDCEGMFDLAVSIETLEHIQPEDADTAVKTIIHHADRVVVTACPPTTRTEERRQRGETLLHLNEQPFGYWVEKFASCGMSLNQEETTSLCQIMRSFGRLPGYPVVPAWYFSSYIAIFRRK